jgi:hypothetical protein
VYAVPGDNPLTVIVPLDAEPEKLPGVDTAVYEVIVSPLLAGAVYATVADE